MLSAAPSDAVHMSEVQASCHCQDCMLSELQAVLSVPCATHAVSTSSDSAQAMTEELRGQTRLSFGRGTVNISGHCPET